MVWAGIQIPKRKSQKDKAEGDCSFMCIICGWLGACLFLSPTPSSHRESECELEDPLAGPLTY